jgi:hypothetical protein
MTESPGSLWPRICKRKQPLADRIPNIAGSPIAFPTRYDTSEFDGLLKWIGPLITDNIQTLQDPTTPQYVALDWLANVDGYDPLTYFVGKPYQIYVEHYCTLRRTENLETINTTLHYQHRSATGMTKTETESVESFAMSHSMWRNY